MAAETAIDTKAAQVHELLQLILSLSEEEIDTLQRVLRLAAKLKRKEREKSAPPRRPRRFIDPNDGGPVWELDMIDDFRRWRCYDLSDDDDEDDEDDDDA